MKKLNLLIIIHLCLSITIYGQSKKEKKWDQAIASLNQSDFVEKYDELKMKIEEQVKEFHMKKNSSNVMPEEIAEVKKSYDESLVKFDGILEEIKKDFTDPQTRQIISKSPERFTRYLETEIDGAFVFYNNNCKRKIDMLVNSGVASIGLMEFGMLISLGKEVYGLFQQYRENTRKMSAEYFDKNFIKDHRLKRWEEY